MVEDVINNKNNLNMEKVDSGNYKIFEEMIRRSTNSRDYKKYAEIVFLLILEYYKRVLNIDEAVKIVTELVSTTDLNGLKMHYNALKEDNKNESDAEFQKSKQKLLNILLNDYVKRFGASKKEAYDLFVLQNWSKKVENLNELIAIIDEIIRFRNKSGNSWDYETHIIPKIIDKSSNFDELLDYLVSATNLTIGLSEQLNDSYIAIMAVTKILDYSSSTKDIKHYIREIITKNNNKINELNRKIDEMRRNKISEIRNVKSIRNVIKEVEKLKKINEDVSQSVDPRELELENIRR